jgi:hypothetical protein
MQSRGIGRGAYDTPQDFLRKLRAHKKRQDPFASDSDDALPPKCDKCDGPHLTDDCPHFPRERDPSPEPGANPFNPFKRKKVPSKEESSSEEEKEEEPRRGPGRPGKDEKPRPPLKKRQRSPPKEEEEEEEEETLTCRKG